MTVSFSGLANRTRGADCALVFEADFGSGAEGFATNPGGCDGDTDPLCRITPPSPPPGEECDQTISYSPSDRGPLETVLLTNPGSCYAKLGRVEPTLEAAGSGGDGAVFSVSTTQHEDSQGFHYWKVSAISVSGGEEYEDGSPVTISHSVGDTKIVKAQATLSTNAEGVPVSVTVTEQGNYYRESKDAEPYVADVTVTPCGFELGDIGECPYPTSVTEDDCPPSLGKEACEAWVIEQLAKCSEWLAEQIAAATASIEATVDDDPYSDTFGQIAALSVEQGGDGYLAWRWKEACHQRMNGSWVLRAKTPTELVSLTLTSCYGSGACVRVVPLGDRLSPKLCIYGNGTGGTITETVSPPRYEKPEDNPWKPYWEITDVTASGGTGYANSQQAVITYSGATVEQEAEITLQANGGVLTGATLDRDKPGKFYIQKEYAGQPTQIREVEIVAKGSGYAKLGRREPVVTATASSGSGATFTPTLAIDQDECGVDYWYIDSVSVSGGTGYQTGAALSFSVQGDGTEEKPASGSVVTSEEPEFEGVPVSVTVSDGGRYYEETDKDPPYVAEVTVLVEQIPPSAGSGAEFNVIVEDNPTSPDFGKIKKVEITDDGQGYSLWGGPKDCEYYGPCGIELRFLGTNKEPEVEYDGGVFRTAEPLVNCNTIPSPADILHSIGHGQVSISRGGTWVPDRPCLCDKTDNLNCTPVPPSTEVCRASQVNFSQTPCLPCRGPCAECDPCPSGCHCSGGSCEPCEGPCDGDNPCPDGCACDDGFCGPGECCYCPARIFGYDFVYVDPVTNQYFWDTEEEANDAADIAVGYGEQMVEEMSEAGYCSVTMTVADPRVVPFFADFLDPPRVAWQLAGGGFGAGAQLLQIQAGCCGVEGDGVENIIGPKFPGTNIPVFGGHWPCEEVPVEEIPGLNCVPCSGCQGDPCCRPGVGNPLP
jgi:hypothetical protein